MRFSERTADKSAGTVTATYIGTCVPMMQGVLALT
jgi:hypothetical protein